MTTALENAGIRIARIVEALRTQQVSPWFPAD